MEAAAGPPRLMQTPDLRKGSQRKVEERKIRMEDQQGVRNIRADACDKPECGPDLGGIDIKGHQKRGGGEHLRDAPSQLPEVLPHPDIIGPGQCRMQAMMKCLKIELDHAAALLREPGLPDPITIGGRLPTY